MIPASNLGKNCPLGADKPLLEILSNNTGQNCGPNLILHNKFRFILSRTKSVRYYRTNLRTGASELCPSALSLLRERTPDTLDTLGAGYGS